MVEGNDAAHPLDDALGNRQAEAGARVAARGGTVSLFKFIEDHVPAFSRNARSGVCHGEADEPFAHRRHTHADAATLGELDRIARQIEQHLTQPRRVAHKPLGHIRSDGRGDFEPLALGAGGQQFDNALDQGDDAERLLDQLELARLDAGKVENFID